MQQITNAVLAGGAHERSLIMTPENRQAFGHSVDMPDSSIKEMRRVAHNVMPEALLRFGLDAHCATSATT